MMTLEHESYGDTMRCMHAWDEMRYMHMKYIAYALMLTSFLFGDHDAFICLLYVTYS